MLNLILLSQPDAENLPYWMIGILVTGFGAALAYIRAMHKESIKTKDEIIAYERSEKEKFQNEVMNLTRDFNKTIEVVGRKN